MKVWPTLTPALSPEERGKHLPRWGNGGGSLLQGAAARNLTLLSKSERMRSAAVCGAPAAARPGTTVTACFRDLGLVWLLRLVCDTAALRGRRRDPPVDQLHTRSAVTMQLAERRRPGGSRRGQSARAIHTPYCGSSFREEFERWKMRASAPFGRGEPPRRRRSYGIVTPQHFAGALNPAIFSAGRW